MAISHSCGYCTNFFWNYTQPYLIAPWYLKLVMVWAAPGFNGLILLSELIWFSVKWAEASIGLVRFGFSYTMGWFGMV